MRNIESAIAILYVHKFLIRSNECVAAKILRTGRMLQ